MYDELVKQLKDFAAELRKAENALLVYDAADAIEELSAIHDEQKAQIILMAAEIEEQQPRWIPVSERLPEPHTSVLLYSGEELYTGYMHSDKRFTVNGSRFQDRPTHWMPLPEPPKEGEEWNTTTTKTAR